MTENIFSTFTIQVLNTLFHKKSYLYPEARLKLIETIEASKDFLAPFLLEIVDKDFTFQKKFRSFSRAVRLLAYLKEPKLFPRLISVCNGIANISEHFPHLHLMLAATAYDRWEDLKNFIYPDKELDSMAIVCLEALPIIWAQGNIPRQELIVYLRSLLQKVHHAEEDFSEFAGYLVWACSSIWPGELLEEIRELYGCRLVDLQVITIDSILADFNQGIEQMQKEQMDRCKYSGFLDERTIGFPPEFPFREYMQANEKAVQEADKYCDTVSSVFNSRSELPGRNSPCSCGSGKKYKKCCGLKLQNTKFTPDSRMLSTKITYEISDSSPQEKMTPEDYCIAFDKEALYANPRKMLEDLKQYVKRYPDIPQLYNSINICYQLMGRQAEANQVAVETLELFPKYLFALINLAEYHLSRGEPEKVPEIFSGCYNLMSLYPEREEFHVSEMLSFLSVMTRYFIAIGDIPRAKINYDIMVSLSPNSQQVKHGREELRSAYLSKKHNEVEAQFATRR